MNKLIKKVVSAVTALAVTLSVAVMFDVPEKISAATEESHSHKVCVGTAHDGCAHENIEFKPYPNDSDEAIVFRGDSYYLTEDIVLSGNSRFFVENGIANLCLNGHSIKKDNGQIIDINNIDGQRAELNICDCAGTGKIENTSDVSGYACITVIDDSSFNLYGGCIDGGVQGGGIEVCNSASWIGSGGTANIYGGSVQTRDNYGVWLHDYGSSLSVYDGEIQASGYHTVYVTDEHCKASVYGGKISGSSDIYSAFCVRGKGASVDINGGEVIGQSGQGTIKCIEGTVEIKGGGVKSESTTGNSIINAGTLVISGGTVSCSGYYGIHNQVDYNNGTISPGITTISGGTVNSAGTAIYNGEESTVEIKGGKITSTSEQYSGIYNYGTLKISGGEIKAKGTYTLNNYEDAVLKISGGTVETENYALYNRTGGSASISGGNISGGGYCIWNNGTLDISDGEITSTSHSVVNHGTLNISGGSFGTENPEAAKYIANNKVLNLSGSPIFNNTSIWLQSNDNITISGALTSSEPYTVYVNSDLPRTITSGWDDRMTDKNASKYFKSPYNGAKIVYRDNEAVMVYYYKITYDANGGSCSIQSAETDSSDKLTSLAVPAREGYSFDGWFTEETGGEQVTTDTVFTDDTTIYAHWTTCNDHIWGDTYEKDENQHWKVCTKCGAESEKSNHTWNDGEETTPPTETTDGVMTYKCTVCNAEKTEKIDKLSHAHTYSDDWTSDENGHWHVASCGHDVKIGEAEHDFGAPTVTPSTCTQHGSEEYICRTCGYKKTVTLGLAEHSFDGEWQKDENNHWKVCTVCSTEKSEVTAHSWNDGEITKQPTENESGVRLYTCTVCKATKTEPIAPLDHTHDWSDEWSKDDTYHWHDCLNNCGEKKDNAAHIWDDGEETTPPTETTDGVMTYKCTVCNAEKTEKIDKLSHTHTYSDDWTSDENGHWHAASCGHDVKIGEAEHDFGAPTVTPSTCTQHGSEEYICRTCGYKKTVTLDLAEHSFDGEWQKDENNHWKVCTVCSTEKSEVTAHSWNDGEITKQPTENESGVRLYTCTVCKATKTEPIAPLDHIHDWSDEWSKDDTYHWHDCLKNCGEKKDNAAHIWNGGTVTKQPMADAEGEKTFECTVCGKTKTETLPPKDEPSDPDSENISVDVQPGENAPDTELQTPFDEFADAVLTPEEQESIKNGIDIKIILIVSDATESVPADDRAKVEAAIRGLSGYKLGQHLDLNLLKIIGDSEGIRITQTNKLITVTFEIPAALRGKAEYSVIRVHGGETEVLRDLDSDSDTVTIETDKFSTYALVYKEKSTPSNPGGGNTSGGNSGDSPDPPTSTSDESDNSGDTPSDDDNPSRDDSSDTTSSESKPTDEDNSDAASSDDGNAASSESDTSSNVSDHSPSESSPSEDNGNPSTGIAVSLIPLVTATAILTVAVKRKKK